MTFSCFWEKEQLSAADPRQTDTHGALFLALHSKPDPVYAADQDVTWTAVCKTLDGRAPKLGPRGITEPCMHMVQKQSSVQQMLACLKEALIGEIQKWYSWCWAEQAVKQTTKLNDGLQHDRVSIRYLVVDHGVGTRHVISSRSLQLDAQPFWQVSKGVHGVQPRGVGLAEGRNETPCVHGP